MRRATFKHTSRTFFDMYNAYVGAYPKYPDFLFTENSAQFELLSELVNGISNDMLDPFTRESAYAFAAQNDYAPVEADGCTVEMTFNLVSSMTKTLSAGYQVGGISPSTGQLVIFELEEDASCVADTVITGNVKQQKSFAEISLGQVLSSEEFLEIPVDGYTGIIKSSASISILGDDWTRVDNFDSSSPTSKHFMLLYQSSGKVRVLFGDGVLGAKPTLGAEVLMSFAVTLGRNGRLDADQINLNTGQDTDIASVTNVDATSGGNDSESVSSIKRNACANVRLRDAVWTQEDLETAARASSSSISKALGIPGIGSAVVHLIPTGGGNPSGGLKTATETFIQAKTQFGVMPVTASDPNYKAVSITATASVRSGFDSPTVLNLTAFALTLASSPIDNEVLEAYDDHGIDACRTDVINVNYSYAFVEADNTALEFIILKWRELLGDLEFRQWGQTLEVGDLWIMGNSLFDYGVDIFNLTAPLTNTTTTSTEIIEGSAVVT